MIFNLLTVHENVFAQELDRVCFNFLVPVGGTCASSTGCWDPLSEKPEGEKCISKNPSSDPKPLRKIDRGKNDDGMTMIE